LAENDENEPEQKHIRRHRNARFNRKHGGHKDRKEKGCGKKKNQLLKDGDTIDINGSSGNTVIVGSNNVDNGDGNGDGNNDGNGNGNGKGKLVLKDTIVISDNGTNNNIFDHDDNTDDNNPNQPNSGSDSNTVIVNSQSEYRW